jgi:hypothetical protein
MKTPWSPSQYFCLRHVIRYGLRKRYLFFSKHLYSLPHHSRVRRERMSRRRQIIAHIRSRFIAVHDRHISPFASLREVIFFIDDMWTVCRLHHSFPLRSARLVTLIKYLMLLDGYASGSIIPRRSWRGPLTNRRHQCNAQTGQTSPTSSNPSDSSIALADADSNQSKSSTTTG